MEQLKHECGVAMIRLLKPQSYYVQKYGTNRYGLNKLYLMMEKQHNRGQEGAGIACVNLNAPVGEEYMFRERAEGKDAITEIFRSLPHSKMGKEHEAMPTSGGWEGSSLFMGHLRYSTTGKHGLQYVHPFLRRNNWRAIPKEEQLAGQEPLPVRQLQHDQYRRGVSVPDIPGTIATSLWRRIHNTRTDGASP